MTLKSQEVIGIAAIRYATYLFILMVYGNNDSVFHRFWHITTFTVHVIACDLEKSLSFDKTVEIISHVLWPISI